MDHSLRNMDHSILYSYCISILNLEAAFGFKGIFKFQIQCQKNRKLLHCVVLTEGEMGNSKSNTQRGSGGA